MGAATALLTAVEEPEVDAVIAESSYYAASETLRSDLSRIFGLPKMPFGFLTGTITELRVGIKIDSLDLGRAVSGLGDTAVLLVGGSADRRMPLSNNDRIYDKIPGTKKELYVVEGGTHGDIWEMEREAYGEKILAFLEQSGFLDAPEPPAGDGDSKEATR